MRCTWIISIVIAGAVMVAAGVGYRTITSSSAPSRPVGPRATLISRLQAQSEYFKTVTCIGTGRKFRGALVTRCNVNTGNPHVQAYCLAKLHGIWVDEYNHRLLPCRPDWKGFKIKIIS
jgi:hypothetical protein